ncbi:MAG TPA: hypothetical protein ENK02_10990, partial [Planctomycetes bacterium]|nr:hypothetical protein [Planctomycetota bacterium]
MDKSGKKLTLWRNFVQCAYAIENTMIQGDFNGDGHNDFYVLTRDPNTGTYVPFLGIWEKPGRFVDQASKAFPLALPHK